MKKSKAYYEGPKKCNGSVEGTVRAVYKVKTAEKVRGELNGLQHKISPLVLQCPPITAKSNMKHKAGTAPEYKIPPEVKNKGLESKVHPTWGVREGKHVEKI